MTTEWHSTLGAKDLRALRPKPCWFGALHLGEPGEGWASICDLNPNGPFAASANLAGVSCFGTVTPLR